MANLEAWGDKLVGALSSSGGGSVASVANYVLHIPTTGYTEETVTIWGEEGTYQVITLNRDKDNTPLTQFTASMITDYPINIDGDAADFKALYSCEIGNASVTFYFTEVPSSEFDVLIRQAVNSSGGVGPVIPDGKTVTPTDDIQTWLACAGITDKSYTTLAEVLSDSTTLAALIADNNAVDYMVRSTTWATIITVPAMTDYTTPSGRVTASTYSTDSDYLPWKAFAQLSNENGWVPDTSDTVGAAYVQYEFADSKSVAVTKLEIKKSDGTSGRTYKFKFSGSNDGINFTDIATDITLSSNESKTIELNNAAEYIYHRVYLTYANGGTNASIGRGVTLQFYSSSIPSDSTAMSYIGLNNYCANTLLADSTWCEAICNSEYFESVLNVKVPVMTSYTTPEGVVSASTENSAGRYAWWAFDNVLNNNWVSANNATTNQWIRYKFTTALSVRKVEIYCINRVKNFIVQCSNDNFTDDTHDVYSGVCAENNVTTKNTFNFVGTSDRYMYWQVLVQDIYASAQYPNISVDELQFYGRADI